MTWTRKYKALKRFRGGFVGSPYPTRTGPVDVSLGGGPGSGRKVGSRNRVQYKDYSKENRARSSQYDSMPKNGITREQAAKFAWKIANKAYGKWREAGSPIPKLRFGSGVKGKKNLNHVSPLGDNINDKVTFSNFTLGKPVKRGANEFVVTLHNRDSYRFVTALNQQGVWSHHALSKYKILQAATSYLPSMALPDAAPTSLAPSNYITVKHFYAKYTIASSSNVLQRMTIYDIMPKHDISITPEQAWADAITRTSYSSDPSTYTDRAVTNIGARPTGYEAVNRHFKFLKTTTVNLSPGEVHVHYTKFNLNRRLEKDRYEDVSGGGTNDSISIGWTTPYLMVLLQSSPVHDTTAKTTAGIETNANVGYAQAAIDCLMETSTSYSYTPRATYHIYRDLTLTVGTDPGIATAVTVDEDGRENTTIS